MLVTAPVSVGELLDKITILEIKLAHIADPAKRANVARELEVLSAERDRSLVLTEPMHRVIADLKGVNEALWRIEDDIRECERSKDFGATFVELARSVYRTNDRRAALKRTLNELTNSSLVEEKSYQEY
jgi:hypothetical protein